MGVLDWKIGAHLYDLLGDMIGGGDMIMFWFVKSCERRGWLDVWDMHEVQFIGI